MKIAFSPPFINQEILDEVTDSLNSGWITTGPKVKALEASTARLAGVDNCLCVNSATSALMLVLHWYGIKRGDEVIVPAYTYAATALAVLHIGAVPVMVDIEDDFNISAERIAEKITEKTKAVIPVDIAGWPCNYAAIREVLNRPATRNKFIATSENQEKLGRILLFSDSAHSIGSQFDNKPTVLQSDMAVFSFHAAKNVTTAEGGAILLNMPEPFDNVAIYAQLRLWTLNGQTKDAFTKTQIGSWKYDIIYPGFKMNMPDVLAAIGLVQLKTYMSELLPRRKEIYERYYKGFEAFGWAQLPPYDDEDRKSSFHLFPLRIVGINEETRDALIHAISETGVAVNVHFIPMPMLTVFKDRGYDIKDYPNTYSNYSREISLPIYPQLSEEQVDYVIKSIVDSYFKVKSNA
ncbi:MAG: dTDP-4-amino-4,6-dideoxygalactose transaminase [Algoriphagus sp.]|jgi:dTDP-4-amino-4,6-dideoxygalactose transaminase